MQNLNHSIISQVNKIFAIRQFSYWNYWLAFTQQQAVLFHLSNLTPRLNKVCIKREKHSNKSKQNNEGAERLSSLVSLRNDLVEMLKNEFKESTKDKRMFSFDINFKNPLDTILIKTSTVWGPSNCYISSGSFNEDKNSFAFNDNQKQNRYFTNGGLSKVNRLEIR